MSKMGLSSLTKKYIMGMTGLFLVLFLLVHCGLNSLIFLNDGGQSFLHAAHFMGTNILMRTLEIGLVLGFLIHIVDGLMVTIENKKSRPIDYVAGNKSKGATWYSKSMWILGILILMFLVVHLGHFWVPNRSNQFATGEEINLFEKMKLVFSHPLPVFVYVFSCFILAWHLLHGFSAAFQSLGFYHNRYNKWIKGFGLFISIVIPFIFAMMPIAMYTGIIQ